MVNDSPQRPSIQEVLVRVLRIAASTVAFVELLRSDWIGGALAAIAWIVFSQVERIQSAQIADDDGHGN